MIKAKIELLLKEAFKPSFLEVIDESYKHVGHAGASQGGHFHVAISSSSFDGKKLLETHRMIYKSLESIKPSIHALAIKVIQSSGR